MTKNLWQVIDVSNTNEQPVGMFGHSIVVHNVSKIRLNTIRIVFTGDSAEIIPTVVVHVVYPRLEMEEFLASMFNKWLRIVWYFSISGGLLLTSLPLLLHKQLLAGLF